VAQLRLVGAWANWSPETRPLKGRSSTAKMQDRNDNVGAVMRCRAALGLDSDPFQHGLLLPARRRRYKISRARAPAPHQRPISPCKVCNVFHLFAKGQRKIRIEPARSLQKIIQNKNYRYS